MPKKTVHDAKHNGKYNYVYVSDLDTRGFMHHKLFYQNMLVYSYVYLACPVSESLMSLSCRSNSNSSPIKHPPLSLSTSLLALSSLRGQSSFITSMVRPTHIRLPADAILDFNSPGELPLNQRQPLDGMKDCQQLACFLTIFLCQVQDLKIKVCCHSNNCSLTRKENLYSDLYDYSSRNSMLPYLLILRSLCGDFVTEVKDGSL